MPNYEKLTCQKHQDTVSSTLVEKLVEDLIPGYRQNAKGLATKLQNVIDSLSRDEIVSTELLQDGLESIGIHVEKQNDLCKTIEQILPFCGEKRLGVIEDLLASLHEQRRLCENARRVLQTFQSVKVENDYNAPIG